MQQLPLGVRWPDHSTFRNFLAGPNRLVVDALRARSGSRARIMWIWGPHTSGKTHLLQAVCNESGAAGQRAAYFPLQERDQFAPAALAGCEQLDVVCVDDAHCIAGDSEWERSLFGLYNALYEHERGFLLTGCSPPAAVPWRLADLRSRLSSSLILQLRPLREGEQVAALRMHARARGLELPAETSSYLMKRFPRDLRSLCALLDTLDAASLAAQRRLTVPFIKRVIDETSGSGKGEA